MIHVNLFILNPLNWYDYNFGLFVEYILFLCSFKNEMDGMDTDEFIITDA